MQDLSTRGVGLRVLTGQGAQIDTTTAAGRLVFGIFAALAEFERELIRERTRAGLTAVSALCRELGIRPVTLYRYVGPQGELREQGREGPRHLKRSALDRDAGGHWLHVGVRPLPHTTRTSVAANTHGG